MSIKYDIPETVWNSYTVRNIEIEDLEALFKKRILEIYGKFKVYTQNCKFP